MTQPAIPFRTRTMTSTRLGLCAVPWILAGTACGSEGQGGPAETEQPDGSTPQTGGASSTPPRGSGGGSNGSGGGSSAGDDGGVVAPGCVPSVDSESRCGDRTDDDCDGFVDCLDPDCDGQSCGEAGLTCQAGGCFTESA